MFEMRPLAARGVVMATTTLVLLFLLPMTGATADKIPLGESAITCPVAYHPCTVGSSPHIHVTYRLFILGCSVTFAIMVQFLHDCLINTGLNMVFLCKFWW